MSQVHMLETACEVHVLDAARPDDTATATRCGAPAEMALHIGFPVCDEHQSDAWDLFLRDRTLYARPTA
jgi:hypothetical protein